MLYLKPHETKGKRKSEHSIGTPIINSKYFIRRRFDLRYCINIKFNLSLQQVGRRVNVEKVGGKYTESIARRSNFETLLDLSWCYLAVVGISKLFRVYFNKKSFRRFALHN